MRHRVPVDLLWVEPRVRFHLSKRLKVRRRVSWKSLTKTHFATTFAICLKRVRFVQTEGSVGCMVNSWTHEFLDAVAQLRWIDHCMRMHVILLPLILLP